MPRYKAGRGQPMASSPICRAPVLLERPSFARRTPATARRVCSKHASEGLIDSAVNEYCVTAAEDATDSCLEQT